MKKLLCWLLLVALMLSLCSCRAIFDEFLASEDAVTDLPPVSLGKTESEDSTEQTTPDSKDTEGYEKADDPLTPEKLEAIGIANDSMTTQQLRQICVDYITLSVSFQWVSDDTYFLVEEDNPERHFTEGKLYGGLPYVNEASGNLYRFMEYYDPETGILDSSGLVAKPDLFATACSGTAGWAWARVINSVDVSWTHSITAAHGFVPVGPYKYDQSIDKLWQWGEDGKKIYYHDTKKICKNNASQTMYESYALTHIADCYSRTGHVAMAVSEPVVVRNEDGTINGAESYIMLAEQGQYTKAKYHLRTTSDGTEYRIRGNDGRPFSFLDMYKAGYLVHTFKEFIGEDPIEPGRVTLTHKDSTATADQLAQGNLTANYVISDVFTKVYDESGKEVYRYVARSKDHFTKGFAAADCLPIDALRQYQDGKHTVKITCQIANGELISVYSGTLVS